MTDASFSFWWLCRSIGKWKTKWPCGIHHVGYFRPSCGTSHMVIWCPTWKTPTVTKKLLKFHFFRGDCRGDFRSKLTIEIWRGFFLLRILFECGIKMKHLGFFQPIGQTFWIRNLENPRLELDYILHHMFIIITQCLPSVLGRCTIINKRNVVT